MLTKNDFYVVLPSNASPNRHPHNDASNFTISWDEPIIFNPLHHWKVALTELSYIYQPHTVTTNLSIEYYKNEGPIYTLKPTITIVRDNSKFHIEGNYTFVSPQNADALIQIRIDHIHERIEVWGNLPFKIDWPEAGFDNVFCDENHLAYSKKHLQSILDDSTLKRESKKFQFSVNIHTLNRAKKIYNFPEDKKLATGSALVSYIKNHCKDIFHEIDLQTSNKRVYFQMGTRVSRIKFFGGLNFVLGFYNDTFVSKISPNGFDELHQDRDTTIYKADVLPQLRRGVKNMYIYASCCQPVVVGHARVPLLKNVFIDASKDGNQHGHMRSLNIHNPMYVDINSTVLNKIHINIRNDAGNLIAFPQGAITVMCLHFKRFD